MALSNGVLEWNSVDISGKDLVTLNLYTNITEIKPLSASGRGLERGLN